MLNIGIAYNLKRESIRPEERESEFDDISTITAIKEAIVALGHHVTLLEADERFYDRLKKQHIDLVFNIAEGLHGESRESHIPAILEMCQIPYTGSGICTQAITLNKSRKKEILGYHKIPTPQFQLFKSKTEKKDPRLKFPLIVKPNAEGSSVGITNASLVFNESQLKKQINYCLTKLKQPVLVESFCPGREFTVSILGNTPPRILPLIEVTFDHLPKHLNPIDSHESKWIYDSPDRKKNPLICPAKIPTVLENRIKSIALKTYQILNCVDLCRMDIRLDAKGVPNVLDVNALPGLTPDPAHNSRFIISSYNAGLTYPQIIQSIVLAAIKRYKLTL